MSTGYLELRKVKDFPRLPLEGSIDLTYRCNNSCCHCWVKIPPNAEEINQELTSAGIRKIVDDARKMGCRKWFISGGEPMLRSDFSEIFDYITSISVSYSINTNGTLITPKIASLMKRKGSKMIALYGATAEVHDHITRTPGSFEATMAGFAYLKEVGAGFIVQLIPMKDNYHQFLQMRSLAKSLSPDCRIGASWLYLSSYGSPERNKEIIYQRLSAKEVIEIEEPDLTSEDWVRKQAVERCYGNPTKGDSLFVACIAKRRNFHINPYGQATFCHFIKEPTFYYDLKKGTFQEFWEEFIPSLSSKVKVNKEYLQNCGSCELRADCRWCPAFGYLEKRSFQAKVEYLCEVAREKKKFKQNWEKEHQRFYRIAGITIKVESDLPITNTTFHPKFKYFIVSKPTEVTVSLRHHFLLPDLKRKDLGKKLYHKPPWEIYKKNGAWIYVGISNLQAKNQNPHCIAVFNHDYSRARIYNSNQDNFLKGNLNSLTHFPTDQIFLAQVLADRQGCYLHSSGVNFNGKGLLFVGNADAGKSTLVTMLRGKAKILCDDRMILRSHPEGFRIYGTWSNGEVAEISSESAPLKAILFLNKADENHLELIKDKREIIKNLLACLIRPFVTAEWWEKMFSVIEKLVEEIPCYLLYFDLSGEIEDLLKQFKL